MPGHDHRQTFEVDDAHPVVDTREHAQRMAAAMFWGITLSLAIWAVVVALVL